MLLTTWAARWQIPPAAYQELIALMGAGAPPERPPVSGLTSEAGVQQARRLIAARRGGRLWRNNIGVTEDETGRVIRYGLANESKQMNAVCKSSDLIGITPVVCPCGHRYGVFTAEECKRPGWHLTPGDKRAQAQLNFIKLIQSLGGIAKFVTSEED